MPAHPPSPSWLVRFRKTWKRLFFWQTTPARSTETSSLANPDLHLVAQVTDSTPLPRWRQLRYLSYVFSRKERTQFWSSLIAGTCFLLIGIGFFVQPHLLKQPTSGGLLSEGLIGGPKWINPVLAPLSDVDNDLSQLVFSGLFRFDGVALAQDLAAGTQTLDGGKTLEVRLREDVRFHDGQPLTADDVVFTINDAIKNPLWHSPLAKAFKDVTAIRIDEHTVQFTVADASLSLPELERLLAVGILPGHIWEDANSGSPQLAEGNLKPIGTGPYQFESFTRDAHGTILNLTLKRFSGYYAQAPYLDQRQFRFYPDRKSAESALQSNQIDALAFVPWSDLRTITDTNQKTVAIELPLVTTVFFNTQDKTLKDVSVRRALQLAIDRGELSEQVTNATLLQTPFPFFEGYSTSTQLANLDGARELLDANNWKLDEATGQRYLQPAPSKTVRPTTSTLATFATTTPLTVSILVPAQGDLTIVADYLKRRWSLLGANVIVEPESREAIVQRALTDHTHQVVLLNTLSDTNDNLSAPWRDDESSLNFSRWTSPVVTAGFAALANATTTEQTIAQQTKITDAILNAHVASFLLRPSYVYILPDTLQGTRNLQIRRPADRLSAAQDWYLQTRYRWQSSKP